MKFGFNKKANIVPQIYKDLDMASMMEKFLVLYNACVDKELKIPYEYVKYGMNLYHIFTSRVNELLRVNLLKKQKCVKFCLVSNVIILSFLKKLPYQKFSNEPQMGVAKLIKLFYNNDGKLHFSLDARDMFSNYVFEKIRLRHPDKRVNFIDGLIILEIKDKQLLGVMPFFEEVDNGYKDKLFSQISFAVRKNMEFRGLDLYLVFPRSPKFCKFIELKGYLNDGAKLKLVPYVVNNKICIKGKK